MRTLVLSLCAVLMLALTGCGGGNETPSLPPAASDSGSTAPAPPAATATVKGKMVFEGQAPVPAKLQTSADPYCSMAAANLTSEETMVSDGGLQNVIVYVSSPVPGTFPTPTEEVVVDQMGCHYRPHVFTVMVNQPVRVRNSDETLHNIHTFPKTNMSFNVGQAVKGREDVTKFTQAEMPVPVRCDVHRWMGAFIGVFSHPYSGVSEEGGNYELKLAPGTYEITAWHEKYGSQTQMVTVADGASTDLNFTFSAATATAAD